MSGLCEHFKCPVMVFKKKKDKNTIAFYIETLSLSRHWAGFSSFKMPYNYFSYEVITYGWLVVCRQLCLQRLCRLPVVLLLLYYFWMSRTFYLPLGSGWISMQCLKPEPQNVSCENTILWNTNFQLLWLLSYISKTLLPHTSSKFRST